MANQLIASLDAEFDPTSFEDTYRQKVLDLIESSLKRDLGVKDMGNLLPGHGGIMDRLDSLVLTLPVIWGLLWWLAPAAG